MAFTGHMNFQALTLMHSTQMVHGLPKFENPKTMCTDCSMSKQVRKSFPSQSKFCAKQVLELVHGDLCGPISPATTGGNRYFLLLVDDFSRIMWSYTLKSKDEALNAFKKFKAHVENGTDKRVKTLRTDRVVKFCSQDFTTLCEESGIERHYKAPYSPQQNGVMERRNRTVVAMARSNEPGTMAYRLLDPQSNKIFVNRDVAFEERKTWPWDQHREENRDQQTTFVVVGPDVQNSEETVIQRGRRKLSITTNEYGV
ncbi:hypothetical protein AgCh_026299 [Apium graveolens]